MDAEPARTPPKAAPKSAIVVLGMHRSGTSAMTRALALAGCALPARLMPATTGNAAGHWEPQDAADLDNAILADLGCDWSDPFGPGRMGRGPLHRSEHLAAARTVIRENYGDADPIVFKEPRAALLLDLWRQALEAEAYRPRFIVMVRHPLEVAQSLAQRNGLERRRALLLWATYMLASETGVRRDRRVIVAFDDLLEQPEATLDRIEQGLDVRLPRRGWAAAAEIEASLRPELVHHRAVDGLGIAALAPIEELYAWFRRAAADEAVNADTPSEVAEWLEGLDQAVGPLIERNRIARAAGQRSLEARAAEAEGDRQVLAEARAALSEAAERTAAAIAAAEQRRAAIEAERDAALERARFVETAWAEARAALEAEAAAGRARVIELERLMLEGRVAAEAREADLARRLAESRSEAEAREADLGRRLAEAQSAAAAELASASAREARLAGERTAERRESRRAQARLAGRLGRAHQAQERLEKANASLSSELGAMAAERDAQRERAEAAVAERDVLRQSAEDAAAEREAAHARATALAEAAADLEARLEAARRQTTWGLQAQVLRRAGRIAARHLGLRRR